MEVTAPTVREEAAVARGSPVPWAHRVVRRLVHHSFRLFSCPWFQVRAVNQPDLTAMGPVILAPNHVSFLDPPVLQAVCNRHVVFLMTELIYRVRAIQWLFRVWGAIPVPEDGAAAGAIKGALRALRDGQVVAIFPEGRISDDGYLNRGHGGVALLLSKSRVPVIPVAILGTHEVLPRSRRWPRRHRVTVVFGAPLRPEDHVGEDGPAFVQRVMDAIAELGAPRRPTPPDAQASNSLRN